MEEDYESNRKVFNPDRFASDSAVIEMCEGHIGIIRNYLPIESIDDLRNYRNESPKVDLDIEMPDWLFAEEQF